MDSSIRNVGWQQYDLEVLAADQKSDGRTHYSAHAWVLAGSEMAEAHLDDNPYTDPVFASTRQDLLSHRLAEVFRTGCFFLWVI